MQSCRTVSVISMSTILPKCCKIIVLQSCTGANIEILLQHICAAIVRAVCVGTYKRDYVTAELKVQRSILRSPSIQGVPKFKDFLYENLNDTVLRIAAVLNIGYSSNDISFARRLHRNDVKDKPLIVRFSSGFIRDVWKSYKHTKKDLYIRLRSSQTGLELLSTSTNTLLLTNANALPRQRNWRALIIINSSG